jgi:hypothetical protein
MHRPGHTEQELVYVPERIELHFFKTCQVISFDHFNHLPLQNLRTREAVRAIMSALSSHHA